jgi:hypothetical protein
VVLVLTKIGEMLQAIIIEAEKAEREGRPQSTDAEFQDSGSDSDSEERDPRNTPTDGSDDFKGKVMQHSYLVAGCRNGMTRGNDKRCNISGCAALPPSWCHKLCGW